MTSLYYHSKWSIWVPAFSSFGNVEDISERHRLKLNYFCLWLSVKLLLLLTTTTTATIIKLDLQIRVVLCVFFSLRSESILKVLDEQCLPPESMNTALNVILGHLLKWLMQLFLFGGHSPYISAFLTEPVNNDWSVTDQYSSVNHCNLCPVVVSKRLWLWHCRQPPTSVQYWFVIIAF